MYKHVVNGEMMPDCHSSLIDLHHVFTVKQKRAISSGSSATEEKEAQGEQEREER